VLVNDVWGGERLIEFGRPFWETDVQNGLRMLDNALATHLITARHALPLLLARPGGLVVEVTDGDHGCYRGMLAYDLVKDAVIRLAYGLHMEVRGQGATALAVTPGFLRSEEMLDHFGVTAHTWRDAAAQDPNFLHSETPRFVGRGVACLAADPERARLGGRVWASWTLADRYGFPDADGARPHWGRHLRALFGDRAPPPLDDGFYRYWGASLLELLAEAPQAEASTSGMSQAIGSR